MFKRKYQITITAILIILILTAIPLMAQDSSKDGKAGSLKPLKVIKFENSEGRKTYVIWVENQKKPLTEDLDGDLLILGSTINVKGKIKGSIVALGSLVNLEPGSSVDGNLVLFASIHRMGNPKIIGGKIVKQDFGPHAYMAVFMFFLFLKGLMSMFLNNSDTVLALFLMIFAKKRLLGVCENIVEKPSNSLIWGAVGFAAFLSMGILFFASIYGAVIMIILLGLFALLFATAYASAAYLIGQKMEDKGWIGKRQFIVKGLIGLAVIFLVQLLLASIPVVGLFLSGLVGMIIRMAGVGATLMNWFVKKPPIQEAVQVEG